MSCSTGWDVCAKYVSKISELNVRPGIVRGTHGMRKMWIPETMTKVSDLSPQLSILNNIKKILNKPNESIGVSANDLGSSSQ